MTKEEKQAIATLERLAKRWPKTLMLHHSGSSPWIRVVRADGSLTELAHIRIRGESSS